MGETVRIGVIGCGRIGRLHCENLARMRGVEIVGVSDLRLDVAKEVAAAVRVGRAFDDPRRLLQDTSIDALVIASPTDTHAPFLWEAATRGKHIFCEKPLDLDLAKARAAVRSAERAEVVLQVGFNRRFDPTFARIAELVRAGDVGLVHVVRISSRDPAPPPVKYIRASGGIFLDMTIHDHDMARYVANDEPDTVYAAGSVLVDPSIGRVGDIDTAAVVLRYRSGALALIDNSRRAVYGYDQRVEVFGSKGCLTAGHRTPTEVTHWGEEGQRREGPLPFFIERYRESYLAEMEAFVASVRERRPALVDGEDGLRAIELAVAAALSRREKRPVQLDEIAAKSEAA
jgi:myo-inositol 2-dehydrogenase/D-chiro-inositol 1-dehydrogenase